MSRHLRVSSLGLLAMAAFFAPPAAAHHSFAMFDNTRSVTLHGKVNYYQWTNPHAYLQIQADDGKGGSKAYTLEMTSPNMLHRGGWSSRTVKPGDEVTAIMSPLRDGQPGGLLLVLTLPNGKQMLPGVPNAQRYKISS